MRAVLDTNVFLAALLHSASCRAILEALRDSAFSLVTSEALMAELMDVLARPKFAGRLSADDRRELIELVRREGHSVKPRRIALAVRDAGDRLVLECAYAADCVVSGDHDLQALKYIGSARVVSPALFLSLLSHR